MRNTEVKNRLRQLQRLIDHVSDVTDDVSLQDHLARYICVMAAGFLEYGLQTIYSDFIDQSSSVQVTRFASKQLRRVTNPDVGTFLETARAFDPQWRVELREFFRNDTEGTKEAINSIMKVRNSVAHGGSADITTEMVRDYLERSVKVLEFIERQCENALRQK